VPILSSRKESTVDKDRIKGKIDEIKGDIKERVGGATKDRKTQGEGMLDQAKGKVQGGVGKVKDEFRAERDRQNERKEPEE
jgi:uncharacterized protein YjbJ (UPF0337 family)